MNAFRVQTSPVLLKAIVGARTLATILFLSRLTEHMQR